MLTHLVLFLTFIFFGNTLSANMSSEGGQCMSHGFKITTSQLIMDYLTWKQINRVTIFSQFYKGCTGTYRWDYRLFRQFADCGIGINIVMTEANEIFKYPIHNVAAVVLLPPGNVYTEWKSFFHKAAQDQLFRESYSWLIISANENISQTLETIANVSLRFDSDLTFASVAHNKTDKLNKLRRDDLICNKKISNQEILKVDDILSSESYKRFINQYSGFDWEVNQFCMKNPEELESKCSNSTKYIKQDNKSVRVYVQDRYKIDTEDVENLKNFTQLEDKKERARYDVNVAQDVDFVIKQLYKVRKNISASLVQVNLGLFSLEKGSFFNPFVTVEDRKFFGYPFVFGIKKPVNEQNTKRRGKPFIGELEDIEDLESMYEFLQYFTDAVNATAVEMEYLGLGALEEDGWTKLLRAVHDEDVDIGVETVIITSERADGMFFTNPIIHSMRNVYFRDADSGTLKDIFLQPFSPQLIASVAIVACLLSSTMFIINKIWKKLSASTDHLEDSAEPVTISQAILFGIEILCNQGTAWSPASFAGRLLLMVGLLFSLVVYNSYSAFITSVLSVRISDIHSVNDLLKTNGYTIGFVNNGQDEAYLQTTEDDLLVDIYARSLSSIGTPVSSVTDGLSRATKGRYALFSSQRAARKALPTLVPHGAECKISELLVSSTYSQMGFPMSWKSAYRKVIGMSLMKMKEQGVLYRIRSNMLPSMPLCIQPAEFTSARLQNVVSAFIMLALGLLAGSILGGGELLWSRYHIKRASERFIEK